MTGRRLDKGSTFDSKDELNVEKGRERRGWREAGWTIFTSFMMTRVLLNIQKLYCFERCDNNEI